jgi:nitroreductase
VQVTEVSRVTAPSGSLIDQLGAPRAEPLRDGTPPDERSLARILETATTVPDHGSLRPWRFAVITGAGRERFAEALVESLHELRGDDLAEAMVAKMRGKAFAAPCAVMLIASPIPESNVPEWEQVASASCTGYAVVLAATALGFGAVWKSAAVLEATPIRALFELDPGERLLGWINLGTPGAPSRKKQSDGGVDDGRPLVTTLDSDPGRPG